MALILHLDTSGGAAIVMLATNGEPLTITQSSGERNHAGNINLLIEESLAATNKKIDDIEAFSVCNGPGSYTGLRIGLSTAKGFCYALNRPLLLNNKLDLLLAAAEAEFPGMPNYLGLLIARTDEYYAAGQGDIKFGPDHITLEKTLQLLNGYTESIRVVGTIENNLASVIQAHNIPFIASEVVNMSLWAAIAQYDFDNKKFADLAYSTPDYLKQVYIAKRSDDANKKLDG